jgi:hypothetical protein
MSKKPAKKSDNPDLHAVQEAVKQAMKSKKSNANKWKEITKAMPAAYNPSQAASPPQLTDDFPIPESVATGLDMPESLNEGLYVDSVLVENANVYKKVPGSLFTNAPLSPGNISPSMMKKVRSAGYGELRTKDPEKIDVDFLPEDEVLPSNENDVEIIRQSLRIERIAERTKVIVVVIDNESPTGNDINLIKCGGDPLGCYAYDAQHDGYYVNCAAYLDLGPISVAYRIMTQGTTECNNIIALPDELIEKYLTPTQKKTLKIFKDKYAAPRYSMHYMQAVNC